MSTQPCPAVLITGGARRIGRAVALAFAGAGWDVALHYNSSVAEAQSVAIAIRDLGQDCVLLQAQLEDKAVAVKLVRSAKQAFPGLQVLVHSASMFKPSGIGEDALELFDAHMNIHVRAAMALGAEFAAQVGGGSIVHFLDTNIVRNKTEYGAYLLSKKTLAALVEMSAVEFAPHIRVNAVAPGLILPPEGKGVEYLEERVAGVPLKRQGNVSHVTDAVLFLVRNDYITGQVIYVDGGEHLI